MDQSKVNPFVGNTETSAGGSPVSAPSNPAANQAPVKPATPSVPVNPYAPAGAPYAPGSNTPAPDFATPSDGPAVPNTGSPAYTNFSPAPSQNQDIFMPSDSPEKPKLFTKKFIIFAVIGVVLIITAVVAGVIVQNNKKPNSNTASAKGSMEKLNSYMNYILYNAQSSADVTTPYSPEDVYYIETVFNSVNDYDSDISEALYSKWNNFYTGLDSAVSENGIVKDYNSLVAFFKLYGQTQPLSKENLVKTFLDDGDSESYIRDYYTVYTNSNSDYSKDMGRILTNYAMELIDSYNVYNKYGCISSGELNDECLSEQTMSQEESAIILKPYETENVKNELFWGYVKNLVYGSWDVRHVTDGTFTREDKQ